MNKEYVKAIARIRVLSVIFTALVAIIAILRLVLNSVFLENLAVYTAITGLTLVTFLMVRTINSEKE